MITPADGNLLTGGGAGGAAGGTQPRSDHIPDPGLLPFRPFSPPFLLSCSASTLSLANFILALPNFPEETEIRDPPFWCLPSLLSPLAFYLGSQGGQYS